jgi:hypothetical protein
MLDHYKGGDSKPLIWTFEPYLVKPGSTDRPSWICYRKIVANESELEARRINWEVASFYRRFVSPNARAASCQTIEGEMKSGPRNGPLYHGISDHYDTTVREPSEGWKDIASATGFYDEPRPVAPQPLAPIESSFTVDLEDTTVLNPGQTRVPRQAIVKIVSTAYRFGPNTELSLELSNTGNAAVRVLINLPNDGQLSRDMRIVSSPGLLAPQRPLKFSSKTTQSVNVQHATVIFCEENLLGEMIGVDIAGFYGLAEGKRAVDTEAVWEFIRQQNKNN